jgi:hypothetical protein
MQLAYSSLDIKKVIMNFSFLYECTLAIGDQGIQARGKSVSKQFGEDLCNTMDEADRSEVCNPQGFRFFWEQDDA